MESVGATARELMHERVAKLLVKRGSQQPNGGVVVTNQWRWHYAGTALCTMTTLHTRLHSATQRGLMRCQVSDSPIARIHLFGSRPFIILIGRNLPLVAIPTPFSPEVAA